MLFALKRTGMCRFPESCERGCGREKSSVVLGFAAGELLAIAVDWSVSFFFLLFLLGSVGAGGSAFTGEGWGECVAGSSPSYSSEYVDGCVQVIESFISFLERQLEALIAVQVD